MGIARPRSFAQPQFARAILTAAALVGALAALIAANHASAASRRRAGQGRQDRTRTHTRQRAGPDALHVRG